VSSTGLVTALTLGSTTITATTSGFTGNCAVTTVAPVIVAGATYVVDANVGNDSNTGSGTNPFKTIQKAADLVNPGDLVVVNDGVYTGGSTIVGVNRSGNSSNWITFRSLNKWGAIIDGQNNVSTTGVAVRSNYIIVQGFEVRGVDRSGMQAYNGNELASANHDVLFTQNKIHDIGKLCTDDTGGKVGINAYATNITIDKNIIYNVGRFAPGESGCTPSTTNWQNHDHGIYYAVGDNLIVRNNIFYNDIRGWAIQRYSGGGAVVTGMSVFNNVFAGTNPNKLGHIVIGGATNGIFIANNIFYQATTAGVWFDSGDGGTWPNAIVENNLSTNGVITPSVSGITAASNILNVDPLFVNPTAFDFHLQPGSPALGKGLTLAQVLDNFDGVLRTGAYNIGAY